MIQLLLLNIIKEYIFFSMLVWINKFEKVETLAALFENNSILFHIIIFFMCLQSSNMFYMKLYCGVL